MNKKFLKVTTFLSLLSVAGVLTVLHPAPVEAAKAVSPVLGSELRSPVELRSHNGVLETTLRLAYSENVVNGQKVYVRNYNGSLIGPTLRVRPGDMLRIRLINDLPPNPPGYNYNTTNLHTHGLHTSPVGNGDNVLLELPPGQSLEYEIYIPPDHVPGTFWYHSHVHGSTTMQVASGAEGMLIIEGGLDDLPEIANAREQHMVFQQLSYSNCGPETLTAAPAKGQPTCDLNVAATATTPAVYYETCANFFDRTLGKGVAPDGAECVENFAISFAPTSWPALGNPITINGEAIPTIRMRPGEVQRWRMVHAGNRETVSVGLARAEDRKTQMVAANIELESTRQKRTPFHVIAYDGIPTGKMNNDTSLELQPGYRIDALVQIPVAGHFELLDLATTAAGSLFATPENTKVLAHVIVEGPPMQMALPSADSLAKVVSYEPVADAEISACQQVVFNIKPPCDNPTGPVDFTVNGVEFTMDAPPRRMVLDTAEEWILQAATGGNHPFHIHVNPFQIISYPSHPELEGVWKDTLLVVGPVANADGTTTPAEVVKVRTRYERYIGEYVLHCHILDHEDQGMMQAVEVVLPDEGTSGSPGLCPATPDSFACPP